MYLSCKDLKISTNFFQFVSPTRWRGTNTLHILDLIITNKEPMISDLEYTSPLGKSDHCVLSSSNLYL
jgi:hypothetical protein